jgi:hypothetical protein
MGVVKHFFIRYRATHGDVSVKGKLLRMKSEPVLE